MNKIYKTGLKVDVCAPYQAVGAAGPDVSLFSKCLLNCRLWVSMWFSIFSVLWLYSFNKILENSFKPECTFLL